MGCLYDMRNVALAPTATPEKSYMKEYLFVTRCSDLSVGHPALLRTKRMSTCQLLTWHATRTGHSGDPSLHGRVPG